MRKRSTRQHKAWGESTRKIVRQKREPVITGGSRLITDNVYGLRLSPASRALILIYLIILGLRFAPPQALYCRLLPQARWVETTPVNHQLYYDVTHHQHHFSTK